MMVDSLNYSYDYGELSNSQKEAIITLIEKNDKNKRDLSNWRPISLINKNYEFGGGGIWLLSEEFKLSNLCYSYFPISREFDVSK